MSCGCTAVFIIYSWNFPLFWSSLQSYMAAGWGKRVVVLDNSANKRVLRDPCEHQNLPSRYLQARSTIHGEVITLSNGSASMFIDGELSYLIQGRHQTTYTCIEMMAHACICLMHAIAQLSFKRRKWICLACAHLWSS